MKAETKRPKKLLAIERGSRLKTARTMAKLTRKNIFQKYNINISTTGLIEGGFNLLTIKRANQFVEVFKKEGTNVTLKWLLEGIDENFIFDTTSKNEKKYQTSSIPHLNTGEYFFDEINYFHSNKENSIIINIQDNSLYPAFSAGDYVGGIKKFSISEIKKFVGEFCIVSSEDERYFVTKIFNFDPITNLFNCGFINPFIKHSSFLLCDIKTAARVTRHWLNTSVS